MHYFQGSREHRPHLGGGGSLLAYVLGAQKNRLIVLVEK